MLNGMVLEAFDGECRGGVGRPVEPNENLMSIHRPAGMQSFRPVFQHDSRPTFLLSK